MTNYSKRISHSFFFLLFCWGCLWGKTLKSQGQVYTGYSPFDSATYRVSVDVMQYHLSGLLVFRRMSAGETRIVFLNEAGTTFFVLAITPAGYQYLSLYKKLDRKAVRKALAKDMGMLLGKGLYQSAGTWHSFADSSQLKFTLPRKGKVVYDMKETDSTVQRIENTGRRKKIVRIEETYSGTERIPESIFVQHLQFRFSIQMKRIHEHE